MIRDAAATLVSVNFSQLEFAAWLEIVALCVVRMVYLPRMIVRGQLPTRVPVGYRRRVMLCMILLGLGSMLGGGIVIAYGPTGWGPLQHGLAAGGKALRVTAVFLYMRTITYHRDGERLWLGLLTVAALFAVAVRDR